MPRRGGNSSNFHIIGENHNTAIRTTASITKILMSQSASAKVAIIAELGMCQRYGVLDKRIVICDEEPECMNIVNCIVTMIATLCMYEQADNRDTFYNLYPHFVRLQWIPQLSYDVEIDTDRTKAIATLIAYVIKMLQSCLAPSEFEDFKTFMLTSLENCKDMKMAMNISNAIRDRWIAQRAKQLAKNNDVVIVVVGLAHLPRMLSLLGPVPEGNVWA